MAGDRGWGKCAHAGCSCLVADDDSDYCSAYCESAGSTTGIACECGHDGCRGEI